MKSSVAHSVLLCGLVGLSDAKVYLAGDSTMASNGANDGVTDGMPHHFMPVFLSLPFPS